MQARKKKSIDIAHSKTNTSTQLEDETFVIASLVPRLSWNVNIYRAESLVSFVRKHDVIKIGQKQKAMFARCSTNYTSTLGVYVIQCPIARYV